MYPEISTLRSFTSGFLSRRSLFGSKGYDLPVRVERRRPMGTGSVEVNGVQGEVRMRDLQEDLQTEVSVGKVLRGYGKSVP